MERITLTAPDISCDHCRRTIERELSSLPGVHAVAVDVPSQRVRVDFDPKATSMEAIVARLDEEGYPAAP